MGPLIVFGRWLLACFLRADVTEEGLVVGCLDPGALVEEEGPKVTIYSVAPKLVEVELNIQHLGPATVNFDDSPAASFDLIKFEARATKLAKAYVEGPMEQVVTRS